MGEEMWREARITASLNHPNIVTVHDCWADMSGCYLVMEVLEGISLEDFIDKGPISLLLFENIVKQSLGALVTAHSAGVLHCDLKPSNLMLLGDPTNQPTAVRVKLLDFGVARLIQEIHPEYFQGVKEVLGSPLYIPPEVFTLESLDERSDLYSLGHILYNALAGRPAISATTMDDILDAHERGIFDSLSSIRPDLSHAFCDWVERLIKRQPSHRFQTSKEALEAFITLQFERTQAIERI
jgi:serine/threonine protein kinase